MGYYIDVDIQNVRISSENIKPALTALMALPDRHYSWVDSNWKSHIKDFTAQELIFVLNCWRYSSSEELDGVHVTYFTGQKMGDCEVLWETLCQFAKSPNPENPPCIFFEGEARDDKWAYRLGGPCISYGTAVTSWSWD